MVVWSSFGLTLKFHAARVFLSLDHAGVCKTIECLIDGYIEMFAAIDYLSDYSFRHPVVGRCCWCRTLKGSRHVNTQRLGEPVGNCRELVLDMLIGVLSPIFYGLPE